MIDEKAVNILEDCIQEANIKAIKLIQVWVTYKPVFPCSDIFKQLQIFVRVLVDVRHIIVSWNRIELLPSFELTVACGQIRSTFYRNCM